MYKMQSIYLAGGCFWCVEAVYLKLKGVHNIIPGYIGGTSKTSNVLAGKIYGIPVSGTHSHSWVMAFDSEISSFRNYAEYMPDNTVLLVDTFDSIQGVKNAIIVAKEMEKKNKYGMWIKIISVV